MPTAMKDIDEPERIAAKDKVYEIVKTTAEYMWQMETAPFLKADGLGDGYKVLADFNGIVLAGEFRANTESILPHGIGPMGTQAYAMATISWRTMMSWSSCWKRTAS